MVFAALATVVLAILACAPALAATSDKFHVSESERAACTPDAMRLCADAYPDADRLLTCMKAKHDQMSETCRPVFDAGIKRRGL